MLRKGIEELRDECKKANEYIDLVNADNEILEKNIFEFNEKVKDYEKLNSYIYFEFRAPSEKKISNGPG